MGINIGAVKFNRCTLVIASTLFLAVTINSVQAQRSCRTPDGRDGQCVQYRKCSVVVSQLTSFGQAIPQSVLNDIRNRRKSCDSGGNQIVVCCETQFLEGATDSQHLVMRSNVGDGSADISGGMNRRGADILSAMNCGNPSRDRVAFGEETVIAEFPWMALLRYNSPKVWNCGASLITNRYVLTAAHCTADKNLQPVGVRLGEHDLRYDRDCQMFGDTERCSPPVQDFGIDKIITHPQFVKNDIVNDIALIRLDREVECKSHIKPICLPITDKSRVLAVDQEYLISGWGTTETGSTSQVLLKALVPQKPVSYCQNIFRGYDISDKHVCAGGNDRKDSCRGDSGGPLFNQAPYMRTPKFVQFGVVSYGVQGCGSEKSYPTIYTRVESFLPWITNELAEYDISTAGRSCLLRRRTTFA